MSRSYKKRPIVKDRNKGMRTFANRKVRNYKGVIPCGKAYRKISESYDICDYIFEKTYNEYLKDLESNEKSFLNGACSYRNKAVENPYYEWAKDYKYK